MATPIRHHPSSTKRTNWLHHCDKVIWSCLWLAEEISLNLVKPVHLLSALVFSNPTARPLDWMLPDAWVLASCLLPALYTLLLCKRTMRDDKWNGTGHHRSNESMYGPDGDSFNGTHFFIVHLSDSHEKRCTCSLSLSLSNCALIARLNTGSPECLNLSQ